jgi:hypothetical protein
LPGVFQEPAAPPFQVFTVAKQHWQTNNKKMVVNILMIVIKKLNTMLQDIGSVYCWYYSVQQTKLKRMAIIAYTQFVVDG